MRYTVSLYSIGVFIFYSLTAMVIRKQYLVSDYMNPKVTTINIGATFRDAVEQMVFLSTNGLVVIDDEQKVVGILSSWDLIEHVVPDYLEEDKHLAAFESGDVFAKRIKEVADHPITDFMTAKVHTIHPDENLMQASTLLSEFKIRQLPVVDDKGVLVGYLNRTDIKRAFGEVLAAL